MPEFLRDIRFGLRLLRRSPVFAITVVLLLGLGIGANTIIFSVVDTLLLRPLPLQDADRLVRLIELHPNNFITWDLPYTLFEQLEKSKDSLALTDPVAQGELDAALEMGGVTQRIRLNAVSRDFFTRLGIKALLGRVLTPEDDTSGALTAVISYEFWQRRFNGSEAALGAKFRLTRRTFTVVGVLPQGINGLTVDTAPDIRVPWAAGRLLTDNPEFKDNPMFFVCQIFAKLRPAATVESAGAEVESLLRPVYEDALIKGIPELAKNPKHEAFNSRLKLEPAGLGVSALRAKFSEGLGFLMACVGLLLLMACANVAGLLLARSAGRTQEVSIRLVLGANPWRVARQLLTESLLLGLLGGALGVVLTYACRPLLLRSLPPIRDRAAELQTLAVHVDVDGRVLLFAFLASVLTALLFGLSPALAGSRQNLGTAMRGSRGATARLSTRNLLVVGQVAVCLLLLAGAGLLVQTFERMKNLDAGFDRDHVVTFTLDPLLQGYDGERARALSRQLIDRTRALPGVTTSAVSSRGLMRGAGLIATFAPVGTRISGKDVLNCSANAVSPDYFRALGMHLQAGRDFAWTDDPAQKPAPVIVNRAFARRFFPGQDPVGKLIGSGGPDGLAKGDNQIVGIVNDAKYRSLREEIPPIVYTRLLKNLEFGFILEVRTNGPPEGTIAAVRETVRGIDPSLALIEVRTLKEEVEISLWQERLLARLSALFACFAAALAAIGLYGALDFAVKARTREIGVRVALGADPGRVAGMLSRETSLLAGAGIVLGLAAYAVCVQFIRRSLYGVAPADPIAIGGALLLVLLISFLAAAPPVWRAVKIDPATALRYE